VLASKRAPAPSAEPADIAQGLTVEGLSKSFGRFAALDDVSLQVRPGEFLAVLGPSGSGKTTLLRMIAGLEAPEAGTVRLGDVDFLAMTPRERRVGMVFQHYALFRHMTVAANIAFGLRVRPGRERPPRSEINARVERLLALVQLEGLGKRYPAQLSGGQRQRVALARALAIEPRVLLLDEPFGALDAKVRKDLRRWLRALHDETGVTTLFVTHDQEEAMDLSDRVAVLRDGRLEQVGSPAELEARPASAFVFQFLGEANALPCRVTGGEARFDGFTAPTIGHAPAGGEVTAWFRPHDTEFAAGGPGVDVTVASVLMRGGAARVECHGPGGALFIVDIARRDDAPAAGARLKLRPLKVYVFDEQPA
jgi:sulfate transport system ATP-binding protein